MAPGTTPVRVHDPTARSDRTTGCRTMLQRVCLRPQAQETVQDVDQHQVDTEGLQGGMPSMQEQHSPPRESDSAQRREECPTNTPRIHSRGSEEQNSTSHNRGKGRGVLGLQMALARHLAGRRAPRWWGSTITAVSRWTAAPPSPSSSWRPSCRLRLPRRPLEGDRPLLRGPNALCFSRSDSPSVE